MRGCPLRYRFLTLRICVLILEHKERGGPTEPRAQREDAAETPKMAPPRGTKRKSSNKPETLDLSGSQVRAPDPLDSLCCCESSQ